jgi:hypothetical protein
VRPKTPKSYDGVRRSIGRERPQRPRPGFANAMAAKRILYIAIANEPPVGYKPDDLPTDAPRSDDTPIGAPRPDHTPTDAPREDDTPTDAPRSDDTSTDAPRPADTN